MIAAAAWVEYACLIIPSTTNSTSSSRSMAKCWIFFTGMIGPADTDLMPAKGTVSGDKLTLETLPRRGRTAAFAQCDVVITSDRMFGTIDTNKGTILFVKRKRG